MTGPEHYAEAERLVALAGMGGAPADMQIVAEAQVHATLAVAAATIAASGSPIAMTWHAAVSA
jgi:hypothetical protein